MINKVSLSRYLAEYERRWRSRQGTTNVMDIDPYNRVIRQEMHSWCKENSIDIHSLLDGAEIEPHLKKLWRKLKKEFPDERWRKRGNHDNRSLLGTPRD